MQQNFFRVHIFIYCLFLNSYVYIFYILFSFISSDQDMILKFCFGFVSI